MKKQVLIVALLCMVGCNVWGMKNKKLPKYDDPALFYTWPTENLFEWSEKEMIKTDSNGNRTLTVKGVAFMFERARNGGVGRIKYLAELYGLNLKEVRDPDGNTLLHRCVQTQFGDEGHTELAEFLLEQGVPVNHVNNEGDTALLRARNAPIARIQLLLEFGADVNISDEYDYTPLMRFAQTGDSQKVKLLLNYGANFRFVNKDNTSAFDVAVYYGSSKVVQLLLEKDKTLANAVNNTEERTPLHCAASRFDRLLDYDDLNETVKVLLANGAKVNARDKDGDSPLHEAASLGSKYRVKALLEYNATVNAVNCEGKTPLLRVFDRLPSESDLEYLGCVKVLLANGAKVNATYRDGNTPLHKVASGIFRYSFSPFDTCEAALKLLLENGADVNARNREGKTPFDMLGEPKSDIHRKNDQKVKQWLQNGLFVTNNDNNNNDNEAN